MYFGSLQAARNEKRKVISKLALLYRGKVSNYKPCSSLGFLVFITIVKDCLIVVIVVAAMCIFFLFQLMVCPFDFVGITSILMVFQDTSYEMHSPETSKSGGKMANAGETESEFQRVNRVVKASFHKKKA